MGTKKTSRKGIQEVSQPQSNEDTIDATNTSIPKKVKLDSTSQNQASPDNVSKAKRLEKENVKSSKTRAIRTVETKADGDTSSIGDAPPQDMEAECEVLGIILTEQEAIQSAKVLLRVEDFFHEPHQIIFRTLLFISDRGDLVSVAGLQDELEKLHQLEEVGGTKYLENLVAQRPSPSSILSCANRIIKKSFARRLLQVSSRIAEMSYREIKDPKVLVADVKHLLDLALSGGSDTKANDKPSETSSSSEILRNVQREVEQLFSQGWSTGVSTGLNELDVLISGLRSPDLWVISGATSSGKTALVLNIAEHVALNERKNVALFSAQMSKEQITQRLISSKSLINARDLRRGFLQDADWHRITNTVNLLHQTPLFINDTPEIQIDQLVNASYKLHAEHGSLGLVVVDDLQNIKVNHPSGSTPRDVRDVLRTLKKLARDLPTVVLVVSRLSQNPSGVNGTPHISDLGEQGIIAQDADGVVLVHDARGTTSGNAKLIVAKQKNGPPGEAKVVFLPEYVKFINDLL